MRKCIAMAARNDWGCGVSLDSGQRQNPTDHGAPKKHNKRQQKQALARNYGLFARRHNQAFLPGTRSGRVKRLLSICAAKTPLSSDKHVANPSEIRLYPAHGTHHARTD
jgi:hypothetical protein